MGYKGKRRTMYAFSFFFGTLLTAAYILWASGIFEEGFTVESTRTSVTLIAAFIFFKMVKDFRRRALREGNKNYKMKATAIALFKSLPWVLAIVIAIAIRIEVYNMFTHLIVISFLQVVGIIFFGFEEYYTLMEENA